ncbi:MAG TPA: hypothetical protein VE089_09200 [Nitrososphaeraceae archaeon]|nr:hypothetical protein [Nitrososphaeraceae archaeon]
MNGGRACRLLNSSRDVSPPDIASDMFIYNLEYKINVVNVQLEKEEISFTRRALSALGISIVADTLDYIAAPIFDTPILGDVFDAFVTGLLYSITKSKISTAINTIEFIPFIGDFIPTYTLSTLMWIIREQKKRNNKRIIPYKKYKVVND